MNPGYILAIGVIFVAVIASAIDSSSSLKPTESPCERDYRTTYIHRGTIHDIGVKQYCRNVNSGPLDPYGLHG